MKTFYLGYDSDGTEFLTKYPTAKEANLNSEEWYMIEANNFEEAISKVEIIYDFIVEVRDREGRQFRNSKGEKIETDFKHRTQRLSQNRLENYCKSLFNSYEDIFKTDNINIEVSVFSDISKTYSVLYSFYGRGQIFVKL